MSDSHLYPLWVLIGGPHRSGTTFLVDLLNTHPQIGIFNEYPIEDLLSVPEGYFRFQDQVRGVREDRAKGIATATGAPGGASSPAGNSGGASGG